ncbi:hypothetical protein [Anaerosporobacter sp.]
MKGKKRILGVVLLVIGIVFYVYNGILPLFAKSHSAPIELLFESNIDAGRYVKGEVHFAYKILEVKNRINFIPIGKEYYYLVFDEDITECVVVRADKDWLENFDKDGFSIDGVEVKGVLKKLNTDTSHIGLKLTSTAENIEEDSQKLSESGIDVKASGYYVDCLSDKYAVYTIVSLFIILVLFIGFPLAIKKFMHKTLIILILLFIFDAFFIVHILEMI